ncbi:AAA family ATPase [Candidatus Dependentiae bacterium]|nr:AAA family ATPase [Candidatus Dependentiae bacterium]
MKLNNLFLIALLMSIAVQPLWSNSEEAREAQMAKAFACLIGLSIVSSAGYVGKLTADALPTNNRTIRSGVQSLGLLLGAITSYKLLYSYNTSIKKEKTAAGSTLASVDGNDAKVTITDPSKISETFQSIGGAQVAKQQLKELAYQLQHPEKFIAMGGKATRGILLSGNPGNGKTLLARALAKEARCNFIAVSTGFFASKYANVGAERVRALFDIARAYAPCIIFIDEFDNIGASRESDDNSSGVRLDHNATLTELLAQMDGFDSAQHHICVIAATNRPKILDKALTRSGRFDKHVIVSPPNTQARLEILKIHTKKTPLDRSVNLPMLAQSTMGMSGADLGNMVNQAIEQAIRNKHITVTAKDFDYARDNILLGQEHPEIEPTREQAWQTAVHEAGHTLLGLFQKNFRTYNQLYKVTITARGPALGVTWFMRTAQDENDGNRSADELTATIAMCLGGQAAEELFFGSFKTGTSNDFEKAYAIAYEMVCNYGMSSVGIGALGNPWYRSNETKAAIDAECRKIIQHAYTIAQEIVANNRSTIQRLATILVKEKTLTGDQVNSIVGIA